MIRILAIALASLSCATIAHGTERVIAHDAEHVALAFAEHEADTLIDRLVAPVAQPAQSTAQPVTLAQNDAHHAQPLAFALLEHTGPIRLAQNDVATASAASEPPPQIDAGIPTSPLTTDVNAIVNADPNAPFPVLAAIGVVKQLAEAAHDGNTALVAGALCMLLMYLLMRVFGLKRVGWLGTPLGGASLSALIALSGALGTTFLAHGSGPITWALAGKGLGIGLGSSAVYSLAKTIAVAHLPVGLHDLIFGKPSAAAVAS